MELGAGERVYMPPMSDDPYRVRSGGVKNRNGMVVAIMVVVVVALGAVAWNTYGATTGPIPVISADGAFKTVAPAPASTGEDTRDVYNMIEAAKGAPTPIAVSAAQVGEAPVAPIAQAPPAAPSAPVAPAAGSFLVQLGALRTPDAAETAWAKLDSAHPGLLRGVRKDVQRAELGADGVYYRLRAGYFDDRAKAVSFCERVKGAGLACMVVVR